MRIASADRYSVRCLDRGPGIEKTCISLRDLRVHPRSAFLRISVPPVVKRIFRSLLTTVNCVTSLECAIGCASECAAEAKSQRTSRNPRAKWVRKSRRLLPNNRLHSNLRTTPNPSRVPRTSQLSGANREHSPTIVCRSLPNPSRRQFRRLPPTRFSGSRQRRLPARRRCPRKGERRAGS